MRIEYDVYCTNCNIVVTSVGSGDPQDTTIGGLLSRFLESSQKDELCCYHGDCMVEDYTIRKAEREMKQLDDA